MEKRTSNNFKEKQKTVAEIQAKIKAAKSVVFVDYKTVTVKEDTELRNKFRDANVEYKVYKNRLVKIALNNLGVTGLDNNLEGQLAVAFSNNAEPDAAKIINDFRKKDKLKLQFGLIGESVLDAAAVNELANLPTMEVLIAKLLGLINSGAQGIAGIINAPAASLARVIQLGVK
ncbi:MAG: 50S ribosomal protein L10 [Firmicutes bacterium]|nr:50S ribosomal protein L10 [Bacillota bacterium]